MFDTQELRAQAPAEIAGPTPLQLPAAAPQPMHLLDRLERGVQAPAPGGRRLPAGRDDDDGADLLHHPGLPGVLEGPDPGRADDAGRQPERERSGVLAGSPSPTTARSTQVIRSRGLARRVVRKLNLAASPLFNGTAPPPRDPISLARQARAAASTWARSLISNPAPRPRFPRRPPTNRRRKPD